MPRRKQRLQVDSGVPSPRPAPAIQIRDTFVSPLGEDSEAAQLARALSHMAPSLARLSGSMHQRQSEDDLRRGTEQARETVRKLDESRKTFADAVRDGVVPAHMNPWMKQGYYEELGRVYAGRLQADLTSAIQQDENLKNSVEMGDYRAFVSEFEQNWLEQNAPEDVRNGAFNVGYGHRRDAILANLEAGWSAQTEQRFTQRSLLMFRDEAVNYLQDVLDHEDENFNEIGQVLRQMLDDKHALGWGSRLTGNALIDAIADVALDRKDSELMQELLDSIPSGPGEPSRSYAIQRSEETAEAIFSSKRREWTRTDREKKDELDAIEAEAAGRFEQAQANGIDQDDIAIDDLQSRALALGDVNTSHRLQTMKAAYQNEEYQDDNELVADFQIRLHRSTNGLTQAELDRALSTKRLSLATHSRLSGDLRVVKSSGAGKAFLEDDPYHEYGEKAVRGYFGSSPDADTPEVAYRRQQAQRQFTQWYMQTFWVEGAPKKNVSGAERRLLIDAMANDLSRVWVPYEDSFSGTFRLSGQDLDWRQRPVDIPDRVEPMLEELEGFLNGTITSRPSPALLSLLTVYQVNLDNREEMEEFLQTQRNFATSMIPTSNATQPKP